jgi:plastocyanin
MKLALTLVAALVVAATASAGSPRVVRITIRHQDQGCHAWAVDGGSYRARQTVRLAAGGVIDFMNDDLMTHRLVQLAGPRLAMPPTMLQSTFHHPGGGNVSLRFTANGTYRFRTIDGTEGDKPVDTTGGVNVLRLTVLVG